MKKIITDILSITSIPFIAFYVLLLFTFLKLLQNINDIVYHYTSKNKFYYTHNNILYLAITHDLEPIAHGIDSPRLNKKDLTNTI